MSKMNLRLMPVLCGMIMLYATGCSRHGEAPIRIGAVLPLTGDAAEYGNNDRMGIDLAIEQANAAGGINGRQIEVLYEDCQLDAKLAVAAINRLAMQKTAAVIDDAVSTVALAMVPVATSNKQVIISTGASNPALSGSSPFFFRIWNSDSEEGVFAARFLSDDLKAKKVAIFYINNDYGLGLCRVLQREISKKSGIISFAESYEGDARDFRPQVAKIKNATPDAVYLIGYGSQTGIACKQLREQGVNAQLVGTVAMEDAQFVKLAGAAAEGIIFPFPQQPTGKIVTYFKETFHQKFGKEPGLLSDCGYDAANLLIQALRNGARTGDEIRQYLIAVSNYEGASGVISFDENGDVHKPMIMKTIRDGAFISYMRTD